MAREQSTGERNVVGRRIREARLKQKPTCFTGGLGGEDGGAWGVF